MKKLKTALVAIVMCVCISFGCFAFTGCADSKTKEELASLKSKVETLQTENNTLKSDKQTLTTENDTLKSDKQTLQTENEAEHSKLILEKLKSAFIHTGYSNEYNVTLKDYPLSYLLNIIVQDYEAIKQMMNIDNFKLNKVYRNINEFSESKIALLENENSISIVEFVTGSDLFSYYECTAIYNSNGYLTQVQWIKIENSQIDNSLLCYDEYVYNINTQKNPVSVDPDGTFSIKSLEWSNAQTIKTITKVIDIKGNYNDLTPSSPDCAMGYDINEIKLFGYEIESNTGELTVNETLNQSSANEYLNNLKPQKDLSGYDVIDFNFQID